MTIIYEFLRNCEYKSITARLCYVNLQVVSWAVIQDRKDILMLEMKRLKVQFR